MSDDEQHDQGRDNVIRIPRIGSHPPSVTPPAPDLTPDGETEPQEEPEPGTGADRISPFDAPAPPPAPPRNPVEAAASPSEGIGPEDTGPPRSGALSTAAILAIAIAAFEGIHSWVQESGPRRAEAAKHKREMEMHGAKANADAARFAAQAGAERAKGRSRVQPSHEYGRNTLGRSSGGPGRGGGPMGATGSRQAASGPHSGSRSQGPSGGLGTRGGGRDSSPSGRRNTPKNSDGYKNPHGNSRNPSSGSGSGNSRTSPGSSGRRKSDTPAGGGRGPTATNGTPHGGSKGGRTTLPQAAGDTLRDRWQRREPAKPFLTKTDRSKNGDGTGSASGVKKGASGREGADPGAAGKLKSGVKGDASPDASRTTFWQAVGETADDRWKKRRAAADAGKNTGPGTGTSGTADPKSGTPGSKPDDEDAKSKKSDSSSGTKSGKAKPKWKWKRKPGGERGGRDRKKSRTGTGTSAGAGAGAWGERTSPWDMPAPEPATVTVTQDGPARRNNPSWEPASIGKGQTSIPKAGAPALPRAPQRAAGRRPGTTRRKDPIPMAPARSAGFQVSDRPPQAVARHMTDISLDDACRALSRLTTDGLDTSDDASALEKSLRTLIGQLESMANDLSCDHNAADKGLMNDVAELMNQVLSLQRWAKRMAADCLDAAELSEAEETSMNRDYRPVADATADAGLPMPSTRLHNEN